MPNISELRLREYAGNDSIELRIGRDENDQQKLVTREGSWGGRLVRELTSVFGTPKTEGYIGAKSEVLKTLKSMYGDDIGTRVFRANIGIVEDGVHRSSRHHPITGRHIKQMIEQGDREMLRKYGKPENGGVSFGRYGLRAPDQEPLPPESSTVDWMLRKSLDRLGPTQDDPPDPEQKWSGIDVPWGGVELRAGLVGPGDGAPQVKGEPMARLLLDDLDRRLQEQPLDTFHTWTLDIGLPNGNSHQIGLRVDLQDPGKVNVFDVKRGEYSIAREDLGTWLNAHLERNYSVEGLQLHHSECKPVLHRTYEGPGQEGILEYFRDEAGKKTKMGNFEVTQQFSVDLHRSNMQITQDGSSTMIDVNNWERVLGEIIGECPEEERKTAVFNLTAMLNQGLGNSIAGPGIRQINDDLKENPFPSGNFMQSVKLEKDDLTGKLRFDVVWSQPFFNLPDRDLMQQPLDPRSRLQCSVSFEIPVDNLRQPNGYETFEIIGGPDIDLKMMSRVSTLGYDPEVLRSVNIGLLREGERLVSPDVGNTTVQARLIENCKEGLDPTEPPSLPGIDETGTKTLGFLVAPSIGRGLHEDVMRAALNDRGFTVDLDNPPPLSVSVTSVQLKDGTEMCEIEYRGGIPEGLLENNPGTELHHLGEQPEGRFGFDTVVRIRLPVSELNRGNTSLFEYVHPSRIEGRPIPNEV